MIHLSQRDARWGGKTIGKSTSLIKDYGCTITCLSMLSDYFGAFRYPSWMATNLSFLVDKVIWKSVSEKLTFNFVWRFYGFQENRIDEAIKNPKTACLLEIKKRHWVVAARKLPGGYWTIDPWTGRGNFYLKSSISGGATFIKK